MNRNNNNNININGNNNNNNNNNDQSSFDHSPIGRFLDLVVKLPKSIDATTKLVYYEAYINSIASFSPELERAFDFFSVRRPLFDIPTTNTKSKLLLLRICNQVLSRLSKTSHCNLAGKILLMIAAACSIDDRSGVNLTGKFHTANTTKIDDEHSIGLPSTTGKKPVLHSSKKDSSSTTNVEVSSTVALDQWLDARFYKTLWSLQSFFSNPSYNPKAPQSFNNFISGLELVVGAFESIKISQPNSGGGLGSNHDSESLARSYASSAFFPKYLTSSHLLHLQLRDSSFRRHILTQAIIIIDYLLNPSGVIKSKNSSSLILSLLSSQLLETGPQCTLTTPHQTQIKALWQRIIAALRSTPGYPNGSIYCDTLLSIVARDHLWNKWKSEKCPDIQMKKDTPSPLTSTLVINNISQSVSQKAKKHKQDSLKKRRAEEMMSGGGGGVKLSIDDNSSFRLMMGSQDLSRLWCGYPLSRQGLEETLINQLQALPVFDEFISSAVEEEKEGLLPDESRLKNDSRIRLKGLRLMKETADVTLFHSFATSSGSLAKIVQQLAGTNTKENNQKDDTNKGINEENEKEKGKEKDKEKDTEKEERESKKRKVDESSPKEKEKGNEKEKGDGVTSEGSSSNQENSKMEIETPINNQ